MDVWLIQDGEKCGPFASFEIERRIREGEIEPDSPSWIEGQGDWQPLSETEHFGKLFEQAATPEIGAPEIGAPALEEAAGKMVVEPPALPARAVTAAEMVRRFWARWFDLHLFGLCWWGGMRWAGHDLVSLSKDMWVLIWLMLPWFAIEAMLIHLWGTTPGKALLGIRVVQADGKAPATGASVWRALRVWTLGLGLGLPLVVIMCQGLSFWITRRVGRPLWDVAGDHRVMVKKILPLRVVIFVGLFAVLAALRGWVLMPVTEEIERQLQEMLREFGAFRK